MTETFYYIVCVILSLFSMLGIFMMSKVSSSVRGNLLLSFCILAGCVATLWYYKVFDVGTIYAFILIGCIIGSIIAYKVQVIQMPQTVAMLNGLSGLAGGIIGALTLVNIGVKSSDYPLFVNVTSILAVVIGLVTFVGSTIAAGKLHRILSQKPVIWKNHQLITILLIVASVTSVVFALFIGKDMGILSNTYFILTLAVVSGSLFGFTFAIRVGGADMPIAISLLTSLAGIASAIAGMAIGDILVVSIGGIVGSSGLILTQIMCRAMNRNLMVILAGKTSINTNGLSEKENGNLSKNVKDEGTETENVKVMPELENNDASDFIVAAIASEASADNSTNVAIILKSAKRAIIIPGYGMALAQAQHQVRQLADMLEAQGTEVKYAIHPVAGRMPGHMNVLLAEADVAYEQLYEMDTINDDFKDTDIVLVIGANDVLNPAARDAKDTPIYGMPVLNADQARYIIICNYDTSPGYAGVPNPLYEMENKVIMLLGDAKESLSELQKMLSS